MYQKQIINRKGTSKITNYQQLILLSVNKILSVLGLTNLAQVEVSSWPKMIIMLNFLQLRENKM